MDSRPRAPIGVFDTGLGSVPVAMAVRRAFPRQDVVHLADRASFPYGGMSPDQLRSSVERAVRHLESWGPSAIVVASNTPSVLCLDEVRGSTATPLVGVFPPVRRALDAVTGEVAVLGTAAMVTSPRLNTHLAAVTSETARVRAVDASALVAKVESGEFHRDPDATREAVRAFVAQLRTEHPAVAALTSSSTHLSWVGPFLREVADDLALFDPVDEVVAEVAPWTREGSGSTTCLATADARYPLADFQEILDRLGTGLTAEPITW